MTRRSDTWQLQDAPLPHYRIEPGGARVVFTCGNGDRRPDLGFAADGRAACDEDRRRLARSLDLAVDRLVFMEQVHGATVAVVNASQAGAGATDRRTAIPGADALITNDNSIALVGLSADCPLVALWDEAATRCAVVHAGWRGLVAGIVDNAVRQMAALGTSVASLRAAIGAAVGPCCYDVGPDVLREMLDGGRATSEHVRREDGQTRLDLVGVALHQLSSAGVDVSQTTTLGECTKCRGDLFHSYRRDGAAAGRQAMAIRLKGPLDEPS